MSEPAPEDQDEVEERGGDEEAPRRGSCAVAFSLLLSIEAVLAAAYLAVRRTSAGAATRSAPWGPRATWRRSPRPCC